MVRLGEPIGKSAGSHKVISIPLWCGWESMTLSSVTFLLYFNSTMVRLGESVDLRKVYRHSFQFHYGAVGSLNLQDYNAIVFISIPLWCGWEFVDLFAQIGNFVFQFHYGAVGRDLNRLYSDNRCIFQFHYGAVGSAVLSLFCHVQSCISIPLWCGWERYHSSPH